MKIWVALFFLLVAAEAYAQSNQTPTSVSTNSSLLSSNWPAMTLAQEPKPGTDTTPGPLSDEAFAARIIPSTWEAIGISNELKPNEITVGKFTLSGIAIEIAKMPNPLQLINPFAPPEYGTAEINLVRDLGDHPSGLKFFSIQF